MLDIARLVSSFEDLEAARKDLAQLRAEFADDPALLRFYEPSAKYLVTLLSRSIREAVLRDLGNDEDAEMWVRLEGRSFAGGRAPAAHLARFLDHLATANRHAVSILERIPYAKGRFTKRVESLAEFDIVTTAPGSLKLGLRRPSLPAPEAGPAPGGVEGQLADLRLAATRMARATQDSSRPIDGLRLVVRALAACHDESEFERLRAEVNDDRRLLELLHFAAAVPPSEKSRVEAVSFYGWKAGEPDATFKVVPDTGARIRQRVMALKQSHQMEYIEGQGVLKTEMSISGLIVGSRTFPIIRCEVPDTVPRDELIRLIDHPVAVSGMVRYDKSGDPKVLEADSLLEPCGLFQDV